MRRSKRIATLTLGGACLLVLASCGEDEKPVDVYKTVDECITKTGDRATCEQDMAAAVKEHEATAPKYQHQASCEEVYGQGNCVPRNSGGGSWFMPAMAGFMLGRMMGGMSQPVYHDRQGYAYAGGQRWQQRRDDQTSGTSTSSSGGYYRTGTTSGTAANSGGSVSRGGFGATGSALSSGS